ncbi:hypothetical protein [Mesobacterium pallidum]|uniref:hypothetical protein n=1 Tax=Mesobacterium pallidum TaxID=2872037 RepID=UPI001EE1BE6C|nr:hypothetical protein [Mesobacterium pallidum]
MTGWIGPLVLLAGAALLAWHMVRPNFRDLRISAAEFLPEFDQSQARRNRFQWKLPLRSLPFLARMVILGAITFALWSHLLPPPPTPGGATPTHLRIVLDGSPSMALGTRAADARAAVETLSATVLAAHPGACFDLVHVGAASVLVPGAMVAAHLDRAVPARDGVAAQALLAALAGTAAAPDCPGPVTHAAIVSDVPAMQVSETLFAGPVAWWQVGAPLENAALGGLRLVGGGLAGVAPRIEVSAHVHGAGGTAPRLAVARGAARAEVTMQRDLARAGGWQAILPYPGPGPLTVTLLDGGAYSGDDRLRATLPDLGRIAVDWQAPDLPRPAAFDAGGTADPLVARLDALPGVPTDRPVILFHDGWDQRDAGAAIGAFVQDHPLLDLVNLDVLEPRLPRGLAALPPGFQPVLMTSRDGGRAVLAVRSDPPGVILPAPTATESQARALGLLMLGNALRHVLSPEARPEGLPVTRLDAAGDEIADPLWESDTFRDLAPPPDLAPLTRSAPDPAAAGRAQHDAGWVPWLMLLAALALLAERVLGLGWRARA